MNFDSFSHGQIMSKLWLCEKLEPYLEKNSKVIILGSWYNVLGFMLSIRNKDKFTYIKGIDKDPSAIDIANKICNAWVIQSGSIENKLGDADTVDYLDADVIINCSVEHMETTTWFNNIPSNTLVCLQSINLTDPNHPWYIKTPSSSLEEFHSRFPVTNLLFSDKLNIDYGSWGYDRYMLIGKK